MYLVLICIKRSVQSKSIFITHHKTLHFLGKWTFTETEINILKEYAHKEERG